MLQQKNDIIRRLEKEILPLQGFKPVPGTTTHIGLGPIEVTFPNALFPTGAIHECISTAPEHAAATRGLSSGF